MTEADRADPGHSILYTVGHSNHSMDRFLGLLAGVRIHTLVDVRSQPYSRHAPQFNKKNLETALARTGLKYLFLGRELGGRPDGPALQKPDGQADYQKIQAGAAFRQGIATLAGHAGHDRTAVMCAEEDPGRCHRFHLLAPALLARGLQVIHLRADGTEEPHPRSLLNGLELEET